MPEAVTNAAAANTRASAAPLQNLQEFPGRDWTVEINGAPYGLVQWEWGRTMLFAKSHVLTVPLNAGPLVATVSITAGHYPRAAGPCAVAEENAIYRGCSLNRARL